MLSRFVGMVAVRVLGTVSPPLAHRLQTEVERIRQIDTRPGRNVELVITTDKPLASSSQLLLWIGADLPRDVMSNNVEVITIGFDGWTSSLRRQSADLAVVSSSIPFGALAAACFGVAEVFKTLLAACVDPALQLRIRRRFVHSWSFSAWTTNRVTVPGHTIPEGLDPLLQLTVEDVIQVGAGAVGNGSVLALRELLAIHGTLPVFDPKLVDSSNLNRCYYFTEDVVGTPKVSVLHARASRSGLEIVGQQHALGVIAGKPPCILISTVDNNEVRHAIQEALPKYVVQGATGETTATVSIHTAVDDRSCLVCRHPDPTLGVARVRPLSIAEAAAATGLAEEVIESARVDGSMEITDGVIDVVAARNTEMAAVLRQAKEHGQDLCGGLGDLRQRFGIAAGPNEASVSFVSVLAGTLAAAETVKLLLRDRVDEVPVLDNVFSIDLARNYARHDSLAFREPARTDCALCRARQESVRALYETFHGLKAS